MKAQIALCICLLSQFVLAQVGIGTNTPDASAILEVQSPNKGFLLPRVALTSTTDITTIPNPVDGLQVYVADNNCSIRSGVYVFYNASWHLIPFEDSRTYNRLIIDNIGLANAIFTPYNATNLLGDYNTLFNGIDELQNASFHMQRNGTPAGDWGFGLTLPTAYTIKQLILNGRNDCCQSRLDNLIIRLYRCGNLIHTSAAITGATANNNVIDIPNIYADEIRFVIPNGANTGNGDEYINFSELHIIGSN